MSRAIRVGLLVVLLICAGCGRRKSEEGAPKSDPAMGLALIDEYIVRDSRGERLRANPWFGERVAWREEPAWDEQTVVGSYSILRVHSDSQSVSCRVIQSSVGFISATDSLFISFREIPSIDTILFEAKATEKGWRLISPRYNPHVSLDSAITESSLDAVSRSRLRELRRLEKGNGLAGSEASGCSIKQPE